jgi:choline kinase
MRVNQNWINSSIGGRNIRCFCESPSLGSNTHIHMPCYEASHFMSLVAQREHMTMGFVCVYADFIFETTRQIYKEFSVSSWG